MKLNKKGFTLIELLAVIVVLSIILAIAIPKITNTIKTSKDAAFKNSVKIIMNVARDYAIKNQLQNGIYKIEEPPPEAPEGKEWLEFKGKEKYTGEWKWEDGKISIISVIDTTSNKYLTNVDNTDIDSTKVITLYTIQNGKDGVTINNDGKSIANKSYISTLIGYTGVEKNIIISNGIESIGMYSFYNSGLTSIIIPNSVTSIEEAAFSNNKLTSLTIPNSVTSIEEAAFYKNQLTSITIPSSVIYIRDSAFNVNQLTSVTIPNSVTSIGNSAFYNNKLTSVIIPNSVTSIGSSAFSYNKLTSVIIPNSVTSIGFAVFADNQLVSITIPDSVKTINQYAFYYNKLTNVTIPNSVTSIISGAFQCNPLTTIKNETGRNFNWKSILNASSCTMTTGTSNDSFINGSCNYNYNGTVNGITYTGSGTVSITN